MTVISPQQILIPKKVYIGDAAELRCTFNSPNPGLKELISKNNNETTELPLVSLNTDDYDIKSIKLSPAGVDFYQLSVSFIPWKTGELKFPPLELKKEGLTIDFQPIQIVSLVSTDSNKATSLHDTAAPLLLPGTTYKLYGALTGFIIFLILIIRIIIKRKSILFYLDTKRLQRKYKKNKKETIRNLYKLVDEPDDSLLAGKIQKLMRNYLEIRFYYPFTHTVSSELMRGWQTVTGGLLSEAKEEAFGEIISSFIRTDYIRYSKEAHFEENEKSEMIQRLVEQIEILESQEKDDSKSSESNIS